MGFFRGSASPRRGRITIETDPFMKTDRYLKGAIVVLLAALVFVIYDGIREKVVVVGDTAASFTITTDSGRRISPSDFGGKLLVLNFWATWCPPCVEEMPSLDQFARGLAD